MTACSNECPRQPVLTVTRLLKVSQRKRRSHVAASNVSSLDIVGKVLTLSCRSGGCRYCRQCWEAYLEAEDLLALDYEDSIGDLEAGVDGSSTLLGPEWEEPLRQCTKCGMEARVGAVDPDVGLWSSSPRRRHDRKCQISRPCCLDCRSYAFDTQIRAACLSSDFEPFQCLCCSKVSIAMSVRWQQVLYTMLRISFGRKGSAPKELLL